MTGGSEIRSTPPGFAWTRDHDFLWVAAGQFLLALGVREEAMRPLGGLRPVYERWEQVDAAHRGAAGAGGEAPAAVGSSFLSSGLMDRLAPAQRAELDGDIGHALAVLLPIGEEALQQLEQHRIRPEVLGLRTEGLRGALRDLRSYAAAEGWRGQDQQAIEGHLDWIQEQNRIETRPEKARMGEVRRIVAILRRMPRPTLRRITKITSTPALMAMVGGLLNSMHGSQIGAGAEAAATGSAGTGPAASGAAAADAGPQYTVTPDGAISGPSSYGGESGATIGSSIADGPRRGSTDAPRQGARPSSRETTFDHRWALIGWTSLVGAAPTLVLAGLLAVGAGMPVAGGVAATVGIAGMVVLTAMAFGGDSSASSRQRALRSNTTGGMLAAWGTWNAGVGLFSLVFSLQYGFVIVAVLGGLLTLIGIAVAIMGSVQRKLARRRAGLSEEDYDVPVSMVP